MTTIPAIPTIRPAADAADVAAAADLIALSFDHLAANHYLVPDEKLRLPVMREFFFLLTEHAANGAGEVLLTEDGAGAAVWFDRTTDPTEPEGYEERITAAAGEYVGRFDELDVLFEKNHPTDPHWHLAFLAVHPDRWGQGLGGALMDHTHARLDSAGIPAYLEATNADNQRVYRRHGYQDMSPSAILLADGTPFYRMWRPNPA
jgi:ribosomal protein S18 acetylase RimI-like enzyme